MPAYTRTEFVAEFDINEADVADAGERIDAYIQGWNLAQMRKATGLTQVQLAHALGVNQSRVSASEHGDPDTMALTTIRPYVGACGRKVTRCAGFGCHTRQYPSAV